MAKIKINDLPNNAANELTEDDVAKISGGSDYGRVKVAFDFSGVRYTSLNRETTNDLNTTNRFIKIG